jgi:hypothetical protein
MFFVSLVGWDYAIGDHQPSQKLKEYGYLNIHNTKPGHGQDYKCSIYTHQLNYKNNIVTKLRTTRSLEST